MLILSRKADQIIQIGDEIKITILSIQGNRVKIGLDAPNSMPILRGELQTCGEALESNAEVV